MYGVSYIIQIPYEEEPRMKSLEIFKSYEEAEKRTKEIMGDFFEEYGEDESCTEYASRSKPTAVMSNGDVTGYIFIKEVKTNN